MLTEKDYCDYDTCVVLEELGYPRYHYDNGGELDKILRMVTLYNAQKWLREKHNMYVHICRPHMKNGRYVWSNEVVFCGCGVSSRGFFLSYEEALSEGIKEAVKILKNK